MSEVSVPQQPALPAEIGDTIAGKYLLRRVVAFGGMGVVYEAHHLDLDQSVAIKFVRAEFTDNDEVLTRFWNEARACAALRSPHVASVFDFGRLEDGQPYLVMEFLEGRDLAEVLHVAGPMSVDEAVILVRDACEGLSEAHALGIVHRDVKLENLFLTDLPSGRRHLKLLDFGISKRAERSTRRGLTNPGESMGSPATMSPEQMRDPSSVDARTDVWAVGAVLYELLAGKPAFDGDGVPQICAKVLSQPAPRITEVRPDVPLDLEAIILSCLEKDRERRTQSISQLSNALARFDSRASLPPHATEERITAPPVARIRESEVPGLPRPRWGLRLGVAALAAAAAAAGATWFYAPDYLPDPVRDWAAVSTHLEARPMSAGHASTSMALAQTWLRDREVVWQDANPAKGFVAALTPALFTVSSTDEKTAPPPARARRNRAPMAVDPRAISREAETIDPRAVDPGVKSVVPVPPALDNMPTDPVEPPEPLHDPYP